MTRQMESLDRGLVAVAVEEGVYVRWRLLGTDPEAIAFDVYRNGTRANDSPITDSTNYLDAGGSDGDSYAVRPIVDGEAGEASKSVDVWERPYKDIPVEKPPESTGPDGDAVTYRANDASVGDLTGNGTYDIVLEWEPSNAKNNAHEGHTSPTFLDAYHLDGAHLWRVNLGRNIRSGSHYSPFLVYDFDGDGRAEVAVRTADGTVDGTGKVIGDPEADHRNERGMVQEGPEYLTVFDGETGEALATTDFEPARGRLVDWGSPEHDHCNLFLGCVAYLDGERPSIVTARGYYAKTALAAFDYRDGELANRWTFDSRDGNMEYEGQGNHQLSVADVDGDGKDEIVYGACVIDHDGTGLYSTGWMHGDALHVGDFAPDRPGLEVFQVHEPAPAPYGASLRDAGTGELIWGEHTGEDTGRGMIADIDPDHAGAEAWAPAGVGLWSAGGEKIGDDIPESYNFGIWWTGDLLRELLDHDWDGDAEVGVGKIERWDHETNELETLRRFDGTYSNNYTKGTPCLSADLLGDWREEVIWRTEDSTALRLYVTTHPTDHRLPTLMHDPQYRLAIAWQNAGYNQPPHPSFYVGPDTSDQLRPDIAPARSDEGE